MLNNFVKAATKLLKWPMSGWYTLDDRNQLSTVGPAELALTGGMIISRR
jgi:hypothetical protein